MPDPSCTAMPPSPGRAWSQRRSTSTRSRVTSTRRHAPPDHQQPGRVHHRSDRRAADPTARTPPTPSRRASTPRSSDVQCRRSRRPPCPPSAWALAYRAPHIRPRRRHRPRRLPALRSQRARDEPAYTQPLMVAADRGAPDRARGFDGARLIEEGVLTEHEEAEAMATAVEGRASSEAHGRPPSASFGQEMPAKSRTKKPVPREGARVLVETKSGREAACAGSPSSFCGFPRASRSTRSSRSSSSGAAPRSTTAASTGATPNRSPLPRCSSTGSPVRLTGQGHRAWHVLPAPRPRAPRRRDRRDRDADAAARRQRTRCRSRSSTRRCPNMRASGSKVRLLDRGRSTRLCSGRRSSATSRTGPRS